MKENVFQRLKTNRYFALVWLIFLVTAIVYSVVTPVFEMSDETRHYAVVKFMADTGRLPVQEPGEAQTHWSHEGNQPPLYYGLAALLTAPIETGTWNDVYWYNPHTSAGIPLRTDNENMTIHTDAENFPWHGYALAVHLVRFLSIIIASITVLFVYLIALNLFEGNILLATITAATAAFTPMFIFISASINNDNMVILFSTIAVWKLVKMAQKEASTWRDVLWLGVIIGFGALSKLYALGLLPLTGALLLMQGYRTKNWRQFWRLSFGFGVVVLAVAGWWYLRNYMLYGDFLALKPMHEVAGHRDGFPPLSVWIYEFQGFRIAYWGLFGGVNVIAQDWIYRLLDWVSLVSALGVLGFVLRLFFPKRPFASMRINFPALWIVFAWTGIMFAGFIYWNASIGASQGRLMFPAIASISALMVLGLSWWLPPKFTAILPMILTGGLLIFAIASPWAYIAPAYAKPPILTANDIPQNITPLNYTFNDEMRLVGVNIPVTEIHAAQSLPVKAYWEVLKPMSVNYSVFIHAQVQGEKTVGQLDTYPGLGALPTTLLSPGDVIADTYPIEIIPQAETDAPNIIDVKMGLYEFDKAGFPRPTVKDAEGNILPEALVGKVKLSPWVWQTMTPTHPLSIEFFDNIKLSGYDLDWKKSAEQLTLYWQATEAPSTDYQVFIQLWNDTEMLMGFDAPPLNGDYPTRWWAAGEKIVDAHTIISPSDLPQGDYRLRVGLYRLDTGERLPAFVDGNPLPDFAFDIALPPNIPFE